MQDSPQVGERKNGAESGWLTALGQVAGLLGLAVAIVYVLGGLVTWIRLVLFSFGNAVTLNVIPQLPRELVISTGLSSIVLWMLVTGGGYFVWRLLRGQRSQPPSLPAVAAADGDDLRRIVGLAAFAGLVTVVATLLSLLFRREDTEVEWWPWILIPLVLAVLAGLAIRFLDKDGDHPVGWGLVGGIGVLGVGVVIIAFSASGQGAEGPGGGPSFVLAGTGALAVAICAVVTLDLRAKLAKAERWSWNSAATIAIATGLWVIPVAPAATVIAATLPLPPAKVCALDGGYEKSGVLIGESADEIFLGENLTKRANAEQANTENQEPRIVTFPLARVEELFIGPDAEGAICDVPRPPSDQPVPTAVKSGDQL